MLSSRVVGGVLLGGFVFGIGGVAASPLALPDLAVEHIRLDQEGRLLVEIANWGNANFPGGVGILTVAVDHWVAAEITLPSLAVDATTEIDTGVVINGKKRRIAVFVDSGREVDEIREYYNRMSVDIDVPDRSGFDLFLTAGVNPDDEIYFVVENIGDQASPDNLPATFKVFNDTGGLMGSRNESVPSLEPGEWTDIVPADPIVLATSPQQIRAQLLMPSFPDLDTVNNTFEASLQYLTEADVDPGNPATPYGALFDANNGAIRDVVEWPPPLPPYSVLPRLGYDDWPEAIEEPQVYPAKAQLREALLRLEMGLELPPYEPPVSFQTPTGRAYLDSGDAIEVYLAHVAHALWLDVHGAELFEITWSLTDLSPAELDYLYLNPRMLLYHNRDDEEWAVSPDGTPSYRFHFRGENYSGTGACAWNPRVVFHAFAHFGMIGTTQAETVFAYTDWFRGHVIHGSGGFDYETDWGTPWFIPPDKLLYPLWGSDEIPGLRRHITPFGCLSTPELLQGTFHAVNIPTTGRSVPLCNPGQTSSSHNRVEFPTARKPCDGPEEPACCPEPPCCEDPPCADTPGLVVAHADNLLTKPVGHTVVPSSYVWLSAEEGAAILDPPIPVDCVDGTCNVECQQASYNDSRYSRLVARQYLPWNWLSMRYNDILDGTDYVDDRLRGVRRGGEVVEYVNPFLFEDERLEFKSALDQRLTELGDGDFYAGGELVTGVGGGSPFPFFVQPEGVNQVSIADAGDDQQVLAGSCVTLDGRASEDDDGPSSLKYLWTCDDPNIVLSKRGTSQPTFIAPLQPSILTFTLIVSDGADMSEPDDVTITVVDIGSDSPLTVSGEGSRYLAVTSAGADSLALLVTSPDYPCLAKYVQADGTLGAKPVFQMPAEWCTVYVGDGDVVPSMKCLPHAPGPTTMYKVWADYGSGPLSEPTSGETDCWGDVDNDGDVDVTDISLATDAFRGDYNNRTLYAYDLVPCVPDRTINIADVTAVQDAFRGFDYPCPYPDPDPCSSCTVDGDCDDTVDCTLDRCVDESCVNTPIDADCPDNGLFCDGVEMCDPALGCVSSGNPCLMGQLCIERTDTCRGGGSGD